MSRPEGFDIEAELTPQSIKLSGLRLKALMLALRLLGVVEKDRRQILGLYAAYIEWDKEGRTMDWGKNFAKGFVAIVLFALSAGITAGLGAVTPEVVVNFLLNAGVNPALIAVVQPAIFALLAMAVNWWKHRGETLAVPAA